MKILWDNYLKDSTITATSENSLYPVENLDHAFLMKKFQAEATSTTVTVLFPEDRQVSMIAYGYNNVQTSSDTIRLTRGATDTIQLTKGAADTIKITLQAQYKLKSSGGSTLYTGVLEVGGDVNVSYLPETTCRSVEITFAAPAIVYIGGLSIGSPLTYDYIEVNPRVTKTPRESAVLTDGGQMISKPRKTLREWQVVIPDMDNDKREETQEMIDGVGYSGFVFADLHEEDDDIKPMYCSFTSLGNIRKNTNANQYSMGISLEERR